MSIEIAAPAARIVDAGDVPPLTPVRDAKGVAMVVVTLGETTTYGLRADGTLRPLGQSEPVLISIEPAEEPPASEVDTVVPTSPDSPIIRGQDLKQFDDDYETKLIIVEVDQDPRWRSLGTEISSHVGKVVTSMGLASDGIDASGDPCPSLECYDVEAGEDGDQLYAIAVRRA